MKVTYPARGEQWDEIGRPVAWEVGKGVKRVNIALEDWRDPASPAIQTTVASAGVRAEPFKGTYPFTWILDEGVAVENSGHYAITAIKDLWPDVQPGDRFRIRVWDADGGENPAEGRSDYFSIVFNR